ncbi:hypothetical protein ABT112_33580 [Streptomyces sp. NPDC002055]
MPGGKLRLPGYPFHAVGGVGVAYESAAGAPLPLLLLFMWLRGSG